jgi:hypothetical protein
MVKILQPIFSLMVIGLLLVACNVANSNATDGAQPEPEVQNSLDGCQVNPVAERQDITMLPDAQVESATGNFVTYQTSSSIDQAVQFYQQEMVKHGWSANEGNIVEPDYANLVYTKAGETAMLMIQPKDLNTMKVVISLNNTQAKPG